MCRLFVAIALLFGTVGCDATGAHKLFGTSNPSVSVSHSWLTGTRVNIGTDFNGEAKGSYNPETKAVEFDVKVNSAPQTVIEAEAARLVQQEKTREMEFAFLLEQQKLLGQTISALVAGVKPSVPIP